MNSPSKFIYSSTLRLKEGEYTGSSALAEDVKDQFVPLFVAPPLTDRDPEKGRNLSADEVLLITGSRISKHWPARLSLLDTQYLCNTLGSMSAHEWMPDLFSIARRKNANCSPVLGLDSNSSERLGARNIFTKFGGVLAIKVPISNTQDDDLSKQLYDIVRVVGNDPESTLIIMNCDDISLDLIEDAFEIISLAVSKIQALGKWLSIIVSGTTYPSVNPAPKNGFISVPRNEFIIWQKLARLGFVKENPVIFGDYAADCSIFDFGTKGGRRPIPHLRYTTHDAWIVFRGGAAISAGDDGSIRSVARKIVSSEYFDGPDFSAADQFIAECANGEGGPGSPTTWRKVNINRHITKTISSLLQMQGILISKRKIAQRSIQEILL